MRLGRHGILARALVAIGLIALSSLWAAISSAAEILPQPAEFSMLTAVIDRTSDIAGPDFHLTKALADAVGLHGTQVIRWRYAVDTEK